MVHSTTEYLMRSKGLKHVKINFICKTWEWLSHNLGIVQVQQYQYCNYNSLNGIANVHYEDIYKTKHWRIWTRAPPEHARSHRSEFSYCINIFSPKSHCVGHWCAHLRGCTRSTGNYGSATAKEAFCRFH